MATLTFDEKLTKAKSKLIMFHPFFASVLCHLPIEADDSIKPPTAATNGRWIKFHPDFVEEHTVQELVFVLCHEVGHVIFQHMFRRKQRQPKRWNVAGDYIINDMLVTEGCGDMPKGALHNPALVTQGNGTTDGVYDLLPEDDGKGGGGLPDQFDTCDDADGDDAGVSELEGNLKVAVAQAAQAAKMCGKLGDKLERFINEAIKPKVSWKDVMRRFASSKAKVERSFQRPKRRFLSQGLYLPSMSGETLGPVAVAIDCSGSVGDKELAEFGAELRAIFEDCKPTKLHVIYFHHEVCKYECFEPDDHLVLKPAGSGGTAFSPIFSYIEEHDIEPECCIVLTDLECHDFGPAPAYPTLWVSNYKSYAPWGEVVMMKSDHL